jgi:hypothetical protein
MIAGILSGLVNSVSQVAFHNIVTGAAVTSISTGDIFNGDEDCWFDVIARPIYDTADSTLNMYFNADNTAANYGYRGISAASTSVADINSTAALVRMAAVASGSTSGFSVLRFYAKQGAVRLMNGVNVCNINGTTVTQIETIGSVYSVTNTNITGLVFAPSAGKLGIGTEIIVIKSNNFTNGTPCGTITTPYIKGAWVRIDSQILASPTNIVTFSGLNGNRQVLYYVSAMCKSAVAGGGCYLRVNNDSGANYGWQLINAQNTTINALRFTNRTALDGTYSGTALGSYFDAEFLLFAPTGFVRPCISKAIVGVSGTTVSDIITSGVDWNNTADNITRLDAINQSGNFDTGSQFDLYALYQ